MTRPPLAQVLRYTAGMALLIAAVVGVLRMGEGLRAPPRLPEVWRVRAEGCAPAGQELRVTQQSGVFLSVAWPGGPAPELSGRLDGEKVRLRGAATACGAGDAELIGRWTPDALTLRARIPGCASCAEGTVTAEPLP